ncbi:MAG TPA: hypothetical protein VFL36_23415 [Myxococcales bacterium]|nr:hypothetical protein [Myxococcales bacterium]
MIAVALALVAAGWLEVAAGGAADSNVSGGAGATPVVDAGSLTARIHAGAALDPSDDDELSAEIGYSAEVFPSLHDLDLHRPSLTLAWSRFIGSRLRLRLAPFAGLRFYGDATRNGWDGGATATLRLRLHRRIAALAGAGYTHRAASDSAFAWDSGRGKAGIDLALWPGSSLYTGYAIDFGEDVFYAATTGGTSLDAAGRGRGIGPGGSVGRGVSTFGADLVAYRSARIAHTGTVVLNQRLSRKTFVEASYAFTAVGAKYQSYHAHGGTLELGVRY